jgi:hypothetical protein
MQIANVDEEVFNADVDTIDAIDADNSELSVLFPTSEAGVQGSRVVVYGWGELDHLAPAWRWPSRTTWAAGATTSWRNGWGAGRHNNTIGH